VGLRAGLDTEARGNILCLCCYHHAGTKGGGHIAPTHSLPWHWIGISGQRFTSAVLYCGETTPQYQLDRNLGGPQSPSEDLKFHFVVYIQKCF
jgi:hypothetical protein